MEASRQDNRTDFENTGFVRCRRQTKSDLRPIDRLSQRTCTFVSRLPQKICLIYCLVNSSELETNRKLRENNEERHRFRFGFFSETYAAEYPRLESLRLKNSASLNTPQAATQHMKLQQITGLLLASSLLCGCRPATDNSRPDPSAAAPPPTAKTPPPVTRQHRFQRIVLPPEEQSTSNTPAGNNSTQPPNHDSSRWLFPRIMAGGCGIADLNQDHLPDLVLIGLTATELPEHATSLLQILQQQPDGSFQDVSQTAQLAFTGIPGGIAIGDFDDDGLSDLCLTGFSDCRLYRNLGNFHFADVTAATPLRTGRWSTSAAFLDFDRDGHLDLFVTNYVDYDPTHHCLDAAGRRDFCSPSVFPRTTDRLFRNTGTAPWFEDVSATSGITRLRGAGLGVAAPDCNDDGWIDIFVANDGHPNFLWINQQNGTFEEEAVLRGVAADAAGQSQGSMGVAVADLDGNLLPDLVVTNLDGESNSVCLNQAGSFQELSSAWQMDSSSWPFTGFGTALADLNHDGYTDFVAVHGRVRR
jgi:hypothetical protein